MADEKKVRDEELAKITGAGDVPTADRKKPSGGGGGGAGGEGPDAKGDDASQPSNWEPN